MVSARGSVFQSISFFSSGKISFRTEMLIILTAKFVHGTEDVLISIMPKSMSLTGWMLHLLDPLLFVCLSSCLSVSLAVCLAGCRSVVCWFVGSVGLSVCLWVCGSVSLSWVWVCGSVGLSVCGVGLSVPVSLSACLPAACLPVCLTILLRSVP